VLDSSPDDAGGRFCGPTHRSRLGAHTSFAPRNRASTWSEPAAARNGHCRRRGNATYETL